MWAYGCGLIASGQPLSDRLLFALGGVLLAGPLVCGTSQVVNDWFDRDVDAINEPQRPIPSGRVSVRAGFILAITWTLLSVLVAVSLGPWVTAAAIVGLVLAWAYSAPPLRLKQNGWLGNTAVGLCYEGLPWFTAAAVMTAGLPSSHSLWLASLYSIGALGIMTLNDFKAIEGDRQMGVRSLPVQLGTMRAGWLTAVVMAVPQLIVVFMLASWNQPVAAAVVAGLLLAQAAMMVRFLRDPVRFATWFSALGVSLYVLGMLASAIAVRGILTS